MIVIAMDVAGRLPYFSERQGRGPMAEPLPFEDLLEMVVSVWDELRERSYFQKAFGYHCVDDGDVPGEITNPSMYFLRTIRRRHVWPYWLEVVRLPVTVPVEANGDLQFRGKPTYTWWDEDTLLDMVEALHDVVSKPTDGQMHTFNDCGFHASAFNDSVGRTEYTTKLNTALVHHDPPYELVNGRLVEKAPDEYRMLMAADVPAGADHDSVTAKIEHAKRVFAARGATLADKRDAVGNLADVLEAIRSDVKVEMLREDEAAIFQLANGFAIRHNKRDQRRDYDRITWLRWTFYVYLATIHAVLRVRAHGTAA